MFPFYNLEQSSTKKDGFMRRIKYAFLALLIMCPFAFAPSLYADDTTLKVHKEREDFAKDFAQTVLTILHNPSQPYSSRKNILRQAFMDSVDIDWIAKFVAGRAWKNAPDEKREHYMSLYRAFLTETYVTNFAENPSKSIYTIKILGVNDGENNVFTVRTQMQLMNQQTLKVDYRVVDNDSHYKVQDIVIENVSLITTHRTEFADLANEQGIDGVIKSLEQHASQGKPDVKLSMK